MIGKWERAVPVYGIPVMSKTFKVMVGLSALGLLLALYRELAGLGPTSGMNDFYGWGIWKTFNVMVLTALGSGAFALGISRWVFGRELLHPLMRMALLTSLLAYACGLMMLGVDAGRPWNFYWILFPWNWNFHSPLAEVAVCMSIYAIIPLALENMPPVLERIYYLHEDKRQWAVKLQHKLHKAFPFVVSLAYLLPMMHQSSLGALMLLAGDRVHPLWQSFLLPLLYVWAAAFMGFACVVGTTLLCSLIWKRAVDVAVLDEAGKITVWLIYSFTALRFLDIIIRGKLGTAFHLDAYASVFWLETALTVGGAIALTRSMRLSKASYMFNSYVVIALGGMLYRFAPTTLAFQSSPNAFYFPSAIEILISLGFISIACVGFLAAVKLLAILPAPVRSWYQLAEYEKVVRPEVKLVGYAAHD
jgi:Ni/Fe-hydrogenase subunit HybB-like protein